MSDQLVLHVHDLDVGNLDRVRLSFLRFDVDTAIAVAATSVRAKKVASLQKHRTFFARLMQNIYKMHCENKLARYMPRPLIRAIMHTLSFILFYLFYFTAIVQMVLISPGDTVLRNGAELGTILTLFRNKEIKMIKMTDNLYHFITITKKNL